MAAALLTPNRNGSASPPKLLGPDGRELAGDGGIPLAHYANFAAIWNQFNQTYNWQFDEALRASWENTMSMRRDCFIWGCLDERYRAVVQSPWHIGHDDQDDDGQRAVAGELEKIVRTIPRFTSLLRNLEDAVWYGRYGVQVATGQVDANGVPQTGIVHHVPVNGDKIQAGWNGVPHVMINATKQQEYIAKGWKVITGMRSPEVVLDKPELRERFLINQYERDDADYYEGEMSGAVAGVGIRSRIYWAWWMRQEMLGWACNYMRKVGTLGLLVFPFAEGNPESEAAAATNIQQAGNRSSLMVPVPAGQDPKSVSPFVISPSNAGIDSLTSMIDAYWERHIERYIVGQNMSDGKDNDSGLGGSGRAEFAAGSKHDKIKGDADRLAETLTTDLLKPLHRWNYPGQRFVYRFLFGVKDPKSADKMEAGIKLAALVEIKADELREAGGFSKPQPGDETVGGGGMEAAPHGLGLDGKPLNQPFEPGPWGGGKNESPAAQKDSGVAATDTGEDQPVGYAFVESEHPRDSDGKFTFGFSGQVFHGSPNKNLTSVKAKLDSRQFDNATSVFGAFFAPDELGAKKYAGKSGKLYAAQLNLAKPYTMEWREFAKFQDPTKDDDGNKVPPEQWQARIDELKNEAEALKSQLEAEGHDGIIVLKPNGNVYEIASFSDVPLMNNTMPEHLQRTDEMHTLQLEVAELRGFTRAQTNYVREEAQPQIVVNVPPIVMPESFSVNLPEQPSPVVNVEAPIVHVPAQPAPIVNVTVPQQAAPQVSFTIPEQPPPLVNVNVPAQEPPVVNVSIPEQAEYEETSEIIRDQSTGLVSKIRKLFKRR